MGSLITAYDIELTYEEFGSGDTVLVLHSEEGPGATRSMAEALAEERRVVMPHQPGFDNSARLPFAATVQDLAYVYDEFMQSNDLVGIPVVGTSMGAWLALELAALGNGGVSDLGLISPVGIKVGSREQRDFVDLYAISEEERLALGFADPDLGAIDLNEISESDLETVSRNKEMFTYYGWKPYLHSVNLKHHARRIGVPIHILAGDSDGLFREGYLSELAALLGDADVHTVEGAGHYPDLEQPRATASTILKLMVSGAAKPGR